MLNAKQQANHDYVVGQAKTLISDKYKVGAAEHKTNLKEDTSIGQMIDFALEEAVDQMVYLITLKQKWQDGDA